QLQLQQHPPDRHAGRTACGGLQLVAGRFSPQCEEWRKGHQDTGPSPVQGKKGRAKTGRTGQAGDGKGRKAC
ncbi:hypothetical protein, partial [Enterococcus faecium]|uniref:hypothetical protein n=1 Tax=Enterococcus faecium TaxID=1352 RepID=UPI003D769B69